LDFARELGADDAVLAGEDGGVAEITRLTEGRGADVVLDFVGEHGTPEHALQFLRQARGGTYVVIGYGGVVAPTTLDLIARELNVLGSIVGSHSELTELMELNRQGKVTIRAQRYPLEEATHAMAELDAGRVLGRAVLIA
jgi:D-arabinose 1-dehydrogenase-like Zn-dependent alcohol dehydrogenase